jgi:hypothetical protein
MWLTTAPFAATDAELSSGGFARSPKIHISPAEKVSFDGRIC